MPAKKAPAKKAAPKKPQDHGESQVQAMFDRDAEQGSFGVAVDPTPNAHYTVAGVTAGLPTPENNHPDNPAAGIHN